MDRVKACGNAALPPAVVILPGGQLLGSLSDRVMGNANVASPARNWNAVAVARMMIIIIMIILHSNGDPDNARHTSIIDLTGRYLMAFQTNTRFGFILPSYFWFLTRLFRWAAREGGFEL